MDLRPKQLADWIGVSSSAVRKWSTEFGNYLSPGAAAGGGRHRSYNAQDCRVLAYVNTLRQGGASTEEIHTALTQLQNNDWRGLPAMPEAPPGIAHVPMIPEQVAETAIDQQRAALMREIAFRDERIDDLETALEDERTAHDETRREVITLSERAGRLEGQLHAVDTERVIYDQQRRLLLRIVAAVAVAAAILLAVVVLLALTGVA